MTEDRKKFKKKGARYIRKRKKTFTSNNKVEALNINKRTSTIICKYDGCVKKAFYARFFDKPERCKNHAEGRKQRYNICKCGKRRPIYGYENERAKCCTQCKEIGMVDVKNKRCKFKGCMKQPAYNIEGETNGIFCTTHKLDGMVDVKNKRCEFKGCMVVPCYNIERENNGRFCATHKLGGMIDVKNRRCEFKGCRIVPVYNIEGETNGIFCTTHKLDGMVDVKNKKCEFKDCMKQPVYNIEGETNGRFCTTHKLDNMVDIKSKKCEFKGCMIRSNYNVEGETNGIFCTTHKLNEMVNVKSKRCEFKDCMKQPIYNIEGEANGRFCATHKLESMVNVKDKRCPNCSTWIDSQRANKKYDNYCARCFQHLFPNDPRTSNIRRKTKEIKVRDYINSNFEGFIHDRALYTHNCDCPSRRRIDHRKLIFSTMLAIETDEHQHRGYNSKDEEIRHDDVYMHYSGKWIWIRFNPDSYKDKNGVRQKLDIDDRLPVLKTMIEKQMERIKRGENGDLMEIYKLYYDEI